MKAKLIFETESDFLKEYNCEITEYLNKNFKTYSDFEFYLCKPELWTKPLEDKPTGNEPIISLIRYPGSTRGNIELEKDFKTIKSIKMYTDDYFREYEKDKTIEQINKELQIYVGKTIEF